MIGNANKTIIKAISNASPTVEKIAPDFSILFNSNIYNVALVQFVPSYKDERWLNKLTYYDT
jgi:hypothetical protein